MPVWVMNVVPIDMQDTLSIIYDRGLIGVYHDWCESFNTYPRSLDLLHASFLFENLTQRYDQSSMATYFSKSSTADQSREEESVFSCSQILSCRCDMVVVVVEIDRILRPGGYLLVQDTGDTIKKLRTVLLSLYWRVTLRQGRFLLGVKGFWRPEGGIIDR